MTDLPFFPAGVRGARALRGSILGAVRAGMNLSQLLGQVEDLYSQQGAQLRANTRAAIERQYAAFVDQEARAQSLAHVPGSVPLSAAWISYATLERSLASFQLSPRFSARFRVSGTIGGVPFEDWKTRYYLGTSALPTTVGGLREDLWGWALVTDTESLGEEAEYTVDQIAIGAI